MVLEQLDIHQQKTEPHPKLHTLYEKLKKDHGFKCKTQNYETFRKECKENLKDLVLGQSSQT